MDKRYSRIVMDRLVGREPFGRNVRIYTTRDEAENAHWLNSMLLDRQVGEIQSLVLSEGKLWYFPVNKN